MKRVIEKFVQSHDAATVFVVAATVVVVIELSLMRLFVPSLPHKSQESAVMMELVCDDLSVLDVSRKIKDWKQDSSHLTERLSGSSDDWQHELLAPNAFSDQQVKQEVAIDVPDIRAKQIMEADFAVNQLLLQSVMTGRNPLANINGKIYEVGDNIAIMGGEIVMKIVSVGSDHAVLHLVDAEVVEETTRTIYLSRKTVGIAEEPRFEAP